MTLFDKKPCLVCFSRVNYQRGTTAQRRVSADKVFFFFHQWDTVSSKKCNDHIMFWHSRRAKGWPVLATTSFYMQLELVSQSSWHTLHFSYKLNVAPSVRAKYRGNNKKKQQTKEVPNRSTQLNPNFNSPPNPQHRMIFCRKENTKSERTSRH